ncbi:MAG: toprim domain-containing protein [Sphingobacterium sp.]
MTTWTNAEQIKDEVSLVDLLARLGHAPAYRSGKELFYKSMLREENTPSLCVNEALNVWFDHGGTNASGINGGNVIDFGIAFWYPSPFNEVVGKISGIMAITPAENLPQDIRQQRPRIQSTRVTNYTIETIKELNSHPAITRYLQSRGIWEVAQGSIKEVYYAINNGPKAGRQFFSAGWQNDAGGWELRNRIGERDFKACLGRKAITTIPGDENRLSLFEGYMDYLSWRQDNPDSLDTVIVLNSVNLLESALTKVTSFSIVDVYFDRDYAGEAALDRLLKAMPNATNRSDVYQGFKDYNEMLMARPPQNILYDEEHIYEKVLSTYRR